MPVNECACVVPVCVCACVCACVCVCVIHTSRSQKRRRFAKSPPKFLSFLLSSFFLSFFLSFLFEPQNCDAPRSNDAHDDTKMSAAANSAAYWRIAGMSYLKYANACAEVVRGALKEPHLSKVPRAWTSFRRRRSESSSRSSFFLPRLLLRGLDLSLSLSLSKDSRSLSLSLFLRRLELGTRCTLSRRNT